MSIVKALMSYQQADEDGVMCIVSRQACDEAADEIERLRAALSGLIERYEEIVTHDWVGRGLTDHDLLKARDALAEPKG